MFRKKMGRPPKKKEREIFVKEEAYVPEIVKPVLKKIEVGPACDCGKPVHPQHANQCWDCSHRK